MKTNAANQLADDWIMFLSICLDESTNVPSSARIAITARLCIGSEVREELVNFVSLPQKTSGTEICKAVVKAVRTFKNNKK